MNNTFYTYIYLDPRKHGNYIYGDYSFRNEPFYVGKGNKNQIFLHLLEANGNRNIKNISNNHKYYKIKNILSKNLEPIILKVEKNLTEQEAFNLEIWFIWAIGRSDLKLGPLTNHSDGGEGVVGHKMSIEGRKKLSEINKGKKLNPETINKIMNSRKGYSHSKETKIKIGNKHKGKIITEETRFKLSTSHMGHVHSEEQKLKISNGNLGKIVKKESREKISLSNKGKSPWNKGHKYSDEDRLRIYKTRIKPKT